MTSEIKSIWSKANSLQGCLSHRKQLAGRRRHPPKEDDGEPLIVENHFVSDEAKLLLSKAWRALARKTQVFTKPENPFIRTRQSHVLEVVGVSVITSEHLGLNTDLVRAAAIGHDLGHVPCGHQGEAWMAKVMGHPEFCHEVMGPIITQKIERAGRGLNLTHETLEAMMCHSGNKAKEGMSQEAWVLRHTDKFTYIFHDVNDIVERVRYPISSELKSLIKEFGDTQRERTTTAISGLVIESAELGKVSFEKSELGRKFKHLRDLMYEVYPHVTQQNVQEGMGKVLEFLEMLKLADPFLLLALMTDDDVIFLNGKTMKDMSTLNHTSVGEMVPYLRDIGKIDLCDPDLDW